MVGVSSRPRARTRRPDPDQRPGRPRMRILARVISVALLPVILLVWHVSTTGGAVPSILLPSPAAVLEAAPAVIGAEGFRQHVTRTVMEILGGYLLGAVVGFSLGLLLGASARLRRAYLPLLSAFDSIPTVILAPVIIAWFGFGIWGKTAQAGIGCFYSVFITTLSGLALAEPDAVRFMHSLQASRWQILTKLRIPAALPAVFGGLQIGATLAIINAIVSEFVAADAGLGFLMIRYRSGFNTAAAFVIILIFLGLGTLSYLLLQFAQRRIVFWRDPELIRPQSS